MSDNDPLAPADDEATGGDSEDDAGDDSGLSLGLDTDSDRFDSAAASTRRVLKMLLLAGVPSALLVVLLYGIVQAFGILSAVIYVFFFLVGFSLIPTAVFLGAPSFPGFLKQMFGSLYFVLGQTAYERGVLVEFDDRYEMCPARRDAVYIDGEWHDVPDGHDNWSILGWQPFALLRYKEEDTLTDKRADAYASANRISDGGRSKIERGGLEEHAPDARVSGLDGEWLIDMKRLYRRSVDKIGDISLMEKAEEIAARKQAKENTISGWETVVGGTIGLILGVATGYVMMGGI